MSSILKYFVSREETLWKKLTSRSSSVLAVRLQSSEKVYKARIQNSVQRSL